MKGACGVVGARGLLRGSQFGSVYHEAENGNEELTTSVSEGVAKRAEHDS